MAIVGKDFRGVRLCEACWNGVHWTTVKERGSDGKMHRTTANHCPGGGCQCPCPQMPADRSGINLRLQQRFREDQKRQTQIPDVGGIPANDPMPREK